MKHFLAYGNSDQESFRTQEVRQSFDYVAVPGTIAAYYPEATAGFVLTLDCPYIVDPRTPLFQDHIANPRASHFSLASHYGDTMRRHMSESKAYGTVNFPPSFYQPGVINEMVQSIIGFQRGYGRRASPKMRQAYDKYRRILALRSPGTASPIDPDQSRVPAYVLSPYFVALSTSDPWWLVNHGIWSACGRLETPNAISPVVAVTSVTMLGAALADAPTNLSSTAFFWVGGFDERKASEYELELLWDAIHRSSASYELVNLYGGFFSICLSYAGLHGFSNGLGYSESRAWPELSSTGAAPARYYLRELHTFVTPAVASLIIETDPHFACPCEICRAKGGQILSLSYGELKQHFALARMWELHLVATHEPADIAKFLWTTSQRFREGVRARVAAEALLPNTMYLDTWASVLRRLGLH